MVSSYRVVVACRFLSQFVAIDNKSLEVRQWYAEFTLMCGGVLIMKKPITQILIVLALPKF